LSELCFIFESRVLLTLCREVVARFTVTRQMATLMQCTAAAFLRHWGPFKKYVTPEGRGGQTGCDKVWQGRGSVALRDVTPVEFFNL